MQPWTQERLDMWTGLDAEAHQDLRAGRVPRKIAEGGAKVVGCLTVVALLLGGAVGAGFGFNAYGWLGPSTGLDKNAFALASAAFFAVALAVLFRRQWSKLGSLNDLAEAPLQTALLELKVESVDERRTFLVAADGRRFLVTRPVPGPFEGRFRVYFIDVAKAGGIAPMEGGVPDLFVVGLELP